MTTTPHSLPVLEPCFIGSSGAVYTYAWLASEIAEKCPWLAGRHIREQLAGLGLIDEFDGGESPYPLPYSFC